MIFDDMDSDLDASLQPELVKRDTKFCTSLDEFLSHQSKGDKQSHCYYEVFQIQINKSFLSEFKSTKKPKIETMNSRLPSYNHELIIKETRLELETHDNIKRDIIHSESGVGSKESIFSSNDSSSIEELSAEEMVAPLKHITQLLDDELSIDKLLQNKTENQGHCINIIEIRSQELPTRSQHVRLFLRKAKTFNNFDAVSLHDNSNLKLESFVSLNEINFKAQKIKAEDEICAICLNSYKLKDFIARLNGCGHVFHKSCIDEWIINAICNELKCLICKSTMRQ